MTDVEKRPLPIEEVYAYFGLVFLLQTVGYLGILYHQYDLTLMAGIGVVAVVAGALHHASKS